MTTVRRERDDSKLSRLRVSQGGVGSSLVIAGVPGKRHKMVGAILTLAADGTLEFFSAANSLNGPFDIAAKGGFVYESDSTFFQCAVGEDFNLTTTGGAAHGVILVETE